MDDIIIAQIDKIVIIHVILCTLYFAWCLKRKIKEAVFRLIVVLLMPFFGFMFFTATYLLNRIMKNIQEDALESLYMASKMKQNIIRSVNFQKDINIVPIEEALMMNNSSIKRQLLLDALKLDAEKYLSVLNKALRDEDTEVSHYAATAITEIKSRFNSEIQALSGKYEKNKSELGVLIPYCEVLKGYLQSGLLDEKSLKRYKQLYSQVLGSLLEIYTSEEKYFIDKINCDIELEDYISAREYCLKFCKTHKGSEDTYFMLMKLYYILRNYDGLCEVIRSLKKSSLNLSNRTVNILRFWDEGGLI